MATSLGTNVVVVTRVRCINLARGGGGGGQGGEERELPKYGIGHSTDVRAE